MPNSLLLITTSPIQFVCLHFFLKGMNISSSSFYLEVNSPETSTTKYVVKQADLSKEAASEEHELT